MTPQIEENEKSNTQEKISSPMKKMKRRRKYFRKPKIGFFRRNLMRLTILSPLLLSYAPYLIDAAKRYARILVYHNSTWQDRLLLAISDLL
jgi:hypothetical protein